MRTAPHIQSEQINPHSGNVLFSVVLLYYWSYLYWRVLAPPLDESTIAYAMTVAPVALIAAFAVLANAAERPVVTYTATTLIVFVAVAVVVSVGRSDLATARTAGLLALTLMWLGDVRRRLSLAVLNGYFVASIVIGAIWFLMGFSEYGLIPGQYTEGEDRGIEWRVSLFPFVPESGFFALIVFLANQLEGRGRSRLVFCGLSLYFLVFSGMRSAVLALMLCEVYIYFNGQNHRPKLRAAQLVLLLLIFVISIALSSAALVLPTLPESALTNYIFRTQAVGDSEEALQQSIARGWIWAQHVGLFLSSPLTGVGTVNFSDVITETLVEGTEYTGSESFVTGWLARLGLCFLPFLGYLTLLCRSAVRTRVIFPGALFLIIGVAGFAYGSFLVPYNFVFLLLFHLLIPKVTARSLRETSGLAARVADKPNSIQASTQLDRFR